jgi:hypothetical protein
MPALALDMINQPAIYEERIACSLVASLTYDVPADIMLAIVEIEGGHPGLVVKNTNGTVDIGPMQFNSAYIRSLKQFGIEPDDVNQPGCYPYKLAAWRVQNHIKNDPGDIWTRAANYHSRNPRHNRNYRAKLIKIAERWAKWLNQYFDTQVVEQ